MRSRETPEKAIPDSSSPQKSPDPQRTAPSLLVSSLRRRLNLAALSIRSVLRQAGAQLRSTMASEEQRKEILEEAQLRTAEDVAKELGNMKGAIMKLGQMASFVALGLSEEARSQLSVLQQSAPPMSWELVEAQIEAELGAPASRIFASIDKKPAAAASIGQVHKARLSDGTQVAVKIQYPGVAQAIQTDLENAWILKRLISMGFPGVDPDAIFEEFRERLMEELDYTKEAANQKMLREAWEGDPVVVIPKVIDELTTQRVLVTEWFDGKKFDDMWKAPQDERNRIGREIYRFAHTCVGTLHRFSGDPHPGNYLFLEDGRIVFLDFGCVKQLDRALLARLYRIVEAVRSKDEQAVLAAMKEAGYIAGDATMEQATPVSRFVKALVAPVIEDKEFRFRPEGQREVARLLLEPEQPDKERGQTQELRKMWNMPKDLVYFNRLNLGLSAVLMGLRAEANWCRLFEEAWRPVAASL
jgi:predicted unusual protein kinase regulating ubiquinone biosynthesis (AarF/ABC1/UbiB family)